MSTDLNASSEKGGLVRVKRSRWRVAAILLPVLVLVIAGWLVTRNVFLLPSDPVEREVARIMDGVRKEERGSRPWQSFLDEIKERFFNSDPTDRLSPNASEQLEALGERAHPFLIPLVSTDPSPAVRELAIQTLAEGNATDAFAVIVRALETEKQTAASRCGPRPPRPSANWIQLLPSLCCLPRSNRRSRNCSVRAKQPPIHGHKVWR
jgi:hypothetical protein